MPIFSPPDDLTPAGMRYVTKMSADNRAFAAALVDMGVRGHIRMVEEDGGWLSSKKMRIERLARVKRPPGRRASGARATLPARRFDPDGAEEPQEFLVREEQLGRMF